MCALLQKLYPLPCTPIHSICFDLLCEFLFGERSVEVIDIVFRLGFVLVDLEHAP